MGKILASIGSAALNLGVSAFNNKLAEKSAEKQYQRQLDFWEKQNAYNSPSNQRALFERAGFNPAAAMGDIAQGSTAQGLSDVPGNEYAQRGAVDAQSLQESFALVAELEKLGAETSAIRSQVQLNAIKYLIDNEQLLGFKLDNKQKEYLLSRLSEMTDANLEKIIAEARNLNSSSDLNEERKETEETLQDVNTAQAANLEADVAVKNAEAHLKACESALKIIQADNYEREVDARVKAYDAQALRDLSAAALNDKNSQVADLQLLSERNKRAASDILGFEIHSLPPVTQVQLMRAVTDYVNSQHLSVLGDNQWYRGTFDQRVKDILYTAQVAETAVIESSSDSSSGSVSVGVTGVGGSHSSSSSSSSNKNKPKK